MRLDNNYIERLFLIGWEKIRSIENIQTQNYNNSRAFNKVFKLMFWIKLYTLKLLIVLGEFYTFDLTPTTYSPAVLKQSLDILIDYFMKIPVNYRSIILWFFKAIN